MFDFQENAINAMDSELENALYVSYCEALLMVEAAEREHIIRHMGPLLRKYYIDYEEYYDDLRKASGGK